ncbi:hypothetical protein E1B28_011152 [Marasmius oreades]|uniref:Cytochrome c oxidase assembly protein COX11, mitochondrial n=1 Tax=Marasmius oreades TaxID=181124 RepID=A0A9P7RU03_9AGAR|nr:uncharacterized protein E1B28_011152 [Marasmius oreades]KAG7089467.1 hypothetical protein E1B28_011152 [Marasmius oreades]
MNPLARLLFRTTRSNSRLHLECIQKCRSQTVRDLFYHRYYTRLGSSWLANRRYLNIDANSKVDAKPDPYLQQPQRPRFQSRSEMYRAKNRALLMYGTAVVVATLGVTYAAVPLYRMFCAATGFAGTPNVGTGRFDPERLVPVEEARRIKVHFNADRSEQLPWSFKPQQKYVSVLPGETSLAFYTANNESKQDIIGIATYNVTPDRVRRVPPCFGTDRSRQFFNRYLLFY